MTDTTGIRKVGMEFNARQMFERAEKMRAAIFALDLGDITTDERTVVMQFLMGFMMARHGMALTPQMPVRDAAHAMLLGYEAQLKSDEGLRKELQKELQKNAEDSTRGTP